MADICSKWRQTALIQLPVTAETLSTVVDKCYTKAHLNTVHFFMWTIKLWFPDIFWVYRHLFTNSMAWGGHISCQGQSKRYFCYLPCMLFYFRQWLNWITEEFEALQKMCVIQTVQLSRWSIRTSTSQLPSWVGTLHSSSHFLTPSVLKTALCFLQWLPTVPFHRVCV